VADKRQVIVIGAGMDVATVVAALKAGAHDVVILDSMEQVVETPKEIELKFDRFNEPISSLKSVFMPKYHEPGKQKAQWKQERKGFRR
jgi:methionine-rich copper-binding protein CopC